MEIVLRGYEVNEPTWFYLSFLLIVAIFFRFKRVWSLRNLDLLLLLLISPGLLLVGHPLTQSAGYAWLFSCSGLWTLRCLFDGWFDKRPKLEPNLNSQGLLFLTICAFGFLMIRAMREPPAETGLAAVREAQALLQQSDLPKAQETSDDLKELLANTGPTTPLITAPVMSTSRSLIDAGVITSRDPLSQFSLVERITVRMVTILSHVAVLLGLFYIGHRIFSDYLTGLSMATIYLLLPCTAYSVGEINHVLPAAFIVWALAFANQARTSGILLGLACGTMLFPIFTLPIWMAYQPRQKLMQFTLAFFATCGILLTSVYLSSPDTLAFTQQTVGSIDLRLLSFDDQTYQDGFWTQLHPAWRIPVIVSFIVLVIVLTFWPIRKSYEILISHTAAIIVATQFWYPQQGGIYVLWYLPLILLLVFRPKLMTQTKTAIQGVMLKTNRSNYEPTELSATPHLSQRLL